ncbi:molybdate ABC transporter substrate-binding protein [uncultured Microbacterium sp.]|uniref:molybdate ABC transporter substrate-binding protein n=1 Tax=uncultured Microbacterium sp. TaxID=191216 RepID=UPI0028ED347D|nr:molybdate ABC transporter substrate-binding protein [uncultured Microbacterium sp.]
MTHSRPRATARPVRPVTALAALVVAVLALAGCASTPAAVDASASGDAATTASTLSGTLTISAAASLKTAFDRLAADFEERNPGVDVLPISYDGSSTLATQIIEGAAVDVFASADQKNMAKVTDASLATDPKPFATNVLTLVVPSGNPGGVTGLADLANPDLDVVLCAAEVPCGAASATLLSNAGVQASADSYEQSVTAVLTKVAGGEADAGLVYVTDAKGSTDVETVATAGADAVVNTYPIVALTGSKNPDAAAAFVAYVLSDDGQSVLRSLGFGAH